MPALSIVLDGDNAWLDLADKAAKGRLEQGDLVAVCALAGGMTSGKASVMVRIEMSDGRTVLAETSLALFLSAARAFAARHGEAPAGLGEA